MRSKRGLCLLRMPSRQIPNLTQSCRYLGKKFNRKFRNKKEIRNSLLNNSQFVIQHRKVQIIQTIVNRYDLRCELIPLRVSVKDVGLSNFDFIKAVIAELICQRRSGVAVLVG